MNQAEGSTPMQNHLLQNVFSRTHLANTISHSMHIESKDVYLNQPGRSPGTVPSTHSGHRPLSPWGGKEGWWPPSTLKPYSGPQDSCSSCDCFFPLSIKLWPKLWPFWSKSGRFFFPHCCRREPPPSESCLKIRTTRAVSLRMGITTLQWTHNSNSALSVNGSVSKHRCPCLSTATSIF